MSNIFIAYNRVSTEKQGRSGLGLEAQQAALARFAETEGYDLTETFSEVETGKGADALDRRPQLSAALAAQPLLAQALLALAVLALALGLGWRRVGLRRAA